MVRETISEAITDEITAKGRDRMNSPDPSGRSASGIKAMARVAVVPTTANVICLVASIAANSLLCPSLSQRSMFSTTTMLSSTNNPRATTKPTMLNWFNENPMKFRDTTPKPNESGMATITINAARQPKGRRVISTNPMAMIKSIPSPLNLLPTFSAWSKLCTS